MRLTQIIEALLFASDAPLTAADLARIDERLDEDTVTAVIDELRSEYDLGERSFQVYDVAGGYQLLTRPEFAAVLERYDTVPQSSRLSTPALEVLAIIAYRQPLARAEIEEIRGVQSAAVLRTLQDRALIDAVGRSEGLGRPLLYGTTTKFLEHFGFRSLEDLPRPDELPVILRSRPISGGEETDATAESAPTAEGAAAATEPSPAEASAEPGPGEATSGAQDNMAHEDDRTTTASETGAAGTVASDDGRVEPDEPRPSDGNEREALSAREG